MIIKSLSSSKPDFLQEWTWDIALVGPTIDERGKVSTHYMSEQVKDVITVNYNPSEITIEFSGRIIDKDEVENELKFIIGQRLIVDTTTMGVAELLILLQALKNLKISKVWLLYIEPINYRRKSAFSVTGGPDDNGFLHRRDFELSDIGRSYIGIPGHALAMSSISNQRVIFLCGFEYERVDQAIENLYVLTNNCYCVFGVPAFSAGWEMDAFANHIDVLSNRGIRDVQFCGSTNPLAVYELLERHYKSLDDNTPLFVAPLATKPMSIGACLFLIDKPKHRVAALYDHPTKKVGRANEVANWNLFEVEL